MKVRYVNYQHIRIALKLETFRDGKEETDDKIIDFSGAVSTFLFTFDNAGLPQCLSHRNSYL